MWAELAVALASSVPVLETALAILIVLGGEPARPADERQSQSNLRSPLDGATILVTDPHNSEAVRGTRPGA